MADIKGIYSKELFIDTANKIKQVYPEFKTEKFIDKIFAEDWDQYEMMQRIHHSASALASCLPQDYGRSLEILKQVAPRCEIMLCALFSDYIVLKGLEEENFEASMDALAYFTKYYTSEFSVRPFIEKYGRKMIEVMKNWAESDDVDIRRLASEGCRIGIPWGSKLKFVANDPEIVLPILEKLKDDPSEYVRKSVANNLNEISKVKPELVIKLAKQWKGESKNTDWILKHGCRTLIKQGNSEIMTLFGFGCAEKLKVNELSLNEKKYQIGDEVKFQFAIENKGQEDIKVRIEYEIGYPKPNERIKYKKFKFSERTIKIGTTKISGSYKLKETSSVKIIAGKHIFKLYLNGLEAAQDEFVLE